MQPSQPEPKPQPSPLVTVGIPFYNAERTLADAIRSVFAQTLTDWELVLVDDGSTDGSLDIARSVDDPRVRLVRDGRNLGLAARLNQIAETARGKYVARMDADDMMHPERFEVQAEFLDQESSVDVVGTGMYILDREGIPIGKRAASTAPLSAMNVLSGTPFMHATVMGRTGWFRRNPYDRARPPFYPRAEDFELWCRAFGHSRFARIPECFYYVNEHASFSLSKYATASLSVIRAQWRYGPRQIGLAACLVLSARQVAKCLVHATAVALRMQDRLIARRSSAITPSEAEEIAAEVSRVRATVLPTGLDKAAIDDRIASRTTDGIAAR